MKYETSGTKKAFCRILAAMLTLSMMPAPVMGQPATAIVAGVVRNTRGNPVSGVKIVARDPSGKVIREAITNGAQGQYALQNLTPGQYQLTLDPLKSPYKGQTVVSAVGAEGLTVNWLVSETDEALATAILPGAGGAGLFGLSPETTGALLFLGGTSALFGLGAGLGAFRERRGSVVSGSQ